MNTSYYNGISGIKTQQFGIDVWANNIANIDMDGFKNSNPEFATVFSTTLSNQYFNPTSNDVGMGSRAQTTSLDLRQGALKTTDSTFDLALSDEGWFGLKGAGNQTYYTRTGSFELDKNGNLVDGNRMYLLGTSGKNITPFAGSNNVLDKFGKAYTADGIKQADLYSVKNIDNISLDSADTQTKITLPNFLYYPATATTNVTISANLNPHVELDSSGDEIPNTEHFSANIISADGEKKLLDMTFTKETNQPNHENIWDGEIQLLSFYEKYDDSKTYDTTQYKVDRSANKVYKIEDTQNAQVQFTVDGSLQSATIPTISNNGTDITINIGDIGKYNGFTSIDTTAGIKNVSSDGKEDGILTKYRVDTNGTIMADFTNGESTPVAKVAVYHFQNDQGLDKASATLLTQSANSGKAFFYKDKNGNDFDTTSVYSNRLEASNTQMSTALTELILVQKAFDASAKSITTSDQMIQKAINMKK